MNALQALREARHLTQAALGTKLGISAVAVAGLEHRWPPPWAKRLSRMADALGVSTDALLGREQTAVLLPELDARDRKLLAALERAAVDYLGPQFLKWVGGWRHVALTAFQGALVRMRDRQEPPTGELGRPLPLPPAAETVQAPPGWYTGWESPRQKRLAAGGAR